MATYLTADELTRLERMVGESHKPANMRMLSEADLDDAAKQAQIKDTAGIPPLELNTANPPVLVTPVDYVITVDLYKAASIAWHQKAGIYAEQFDFSADGGTFSRSQGYHMCIAQAKRYADMSQGWVPITQGVPADGDARDAFQDYLDDGGGLPS